MTSVAHADIDETGSITTDQNLRYQQSLAGRKLAVLVLPTTSWPRLRGRIDEIVAALASLKSGDYVELPR
jgi:hypothetical protein